MLNSESNNNPEIHRDNSLEFERPEVAPDSEDVVFKTANMIEMGAEKDPWGILAKLKALLAKKG